MTTDCCQLSTLRLRSAQAVNCQLSTVKSPHDKHFLLTKMNATPAKPLFLLTND
ncbi:hypothetical protein [Microcoleus sp. ARI1-A2]|uniref:hypothetical protein n=1 Tax=Microcoleus sp. ARI1-A2 TaxID=2818557 RepID=UPI002FD26C07